MKNRIKAVVVLLVGVAAMLGLALAGGSSASAATVGAQSFTGLSTNASATTNPVIANGVIHAAGRDHELNNTTDVFSFRRGSLLIVHHARSNRDHLDRATCLEQFRESGVYRIVAGSRDYRGARGVGVYRVNGTVLFAAAPSGRCLTNHAPVLFSLTIQARGNISLPLV